MTNPNALSPALLAEELPLEAVHAAFAARREAAIEFSHNEVERDFWLGGLSLDLALHPATEAGEAEDYFDDAAIFWQRAQDHPEQSTKTWSTRTYSALLQTSLPIFKLRKAHQSGGDLEPSAEVWDEIDYNSAVILDELRRNPEVGHDDKVGFTIQIGTQLLCGSVRILTYPATGRELNKAPFEVVPGHTPLAHRLYTIDDGAKVSLDLRMRYGRHERSNQVLIPFGPLAQMYLKANAPDLVQEYRGFADYTQLVGDWLIKMAKGEELPRHAANVIRYMSDNIGERIDTFVAD